MSSLLKALQASCQKIEKAVTSWNQNFLADLASLREEGLSTDTELVVFDKNGVASTPILVHSLVLAAVSPALASILSSSGDAFEGFTLVLPGEDRTDVENAIIDLYLGKEGGVAFLQSFGLIGGGSSKGKNEDVKEEEPSDKDQDFDRDDNLNDFGEPEGREDNSDELPSPNFIKSQILPNLGKLSEKVQRSSRSLQKISYAEDKENDGWDENIDQKKEANKKEEGDLEDEDDWKPEKIFELMSRNGSNVKPLKQHKVPVLPKQISQPVERSQVKTHQPKVLGKPSKVVELCGVQVQMYQDGRAQCPDCDAIVHSPSVFKKHYESVHLKLKETCEHCGKEYSKYLLKLHIQRKHSSQRYYCDQCDYSSTFNGDIRIHKTSQHDDTKYMCEECAKEFCSATVLKQHIRVKHSGNVFSCDQCDFKTTTTLDLLKSHIRLVHTAAKFLCKFCSFIGDTNQQLEEHKHIFHANEAWESPGMSSEQKRREKELQMDFTCKECGHKLTTRQGLNFHMNATHKGVRFKCTEEGCDFTGTQRVQIRQHIDSKHRGLRRFCDMCDYSAALPTGVRIHKLRVHKVSPPIFACDQCKYRTQDDEKMRKHMVTLHS